MSRPLALFVDDHKERCQQGKLHISRDSPTPEEAAIVGRLEVRVDVSNHEQLCPPVLVTLVVHETGLVPDWARAQVWEDCPACEEDEVVHWGESKVLARPELQNVEPTDVTLRFVEAEELVGTQEG